MTRLTATDAMFAYAHTPEVPMNMGSVQILSLPQNYKGDYFTDCKKKIPSKRATRPQATELTPNLIGLRPTGIFYFASTLTREQAPEISFFKGSESGNAVLAIWIPMGTHLTDPKERIAYMKAEADECKGFLTELLEATSAGKGIKLPSFFMRIMALPMSSQWLSQQSPPLGNVALSNVPSPTKHIHVAGAKVESLYGMPMLLQAQAISCTFSSYAGQVVASILCCEEALPDPERLFAYMDDELLLKKLYKKPAKKAAAKRRTK